MSEVRKKVLVAPLDWGLGHATRCIPIIIALMKRNCEVIIASSGSAADLLKGEFPRLRHFSLPPYQPVYPKGSAMVVAMAQQLPKFIRVIQQERRQTEQIVRKENIDLVISDNRYGCYSLQVKSVFITHQVHILMPLHLKWMEPILNRINHRLIRNYSACWIPADDDSLFPDLMKGREKLSHRFIGYLSRLSKRQYAKKYQVLAIASGPSPQRELFADVLAGQLKSSGLKSLLVRGEFCNKPQTVQTGKYSERAYMNRAEINQAISESELVICRSGYSSMMDLMQLGSQAVFVPTPGQTEQEYLARVLKQKGIAYSTTQKYFDLKKAITETEKYSSFKNFEGSDTLLCQALDSIL